VGNAVFHSSSSGIEYISCDVGVAEIGLAITSASRHNKSDVFVANVQISIDTFIISWTWVNSSTFTGVNQYKLLKNLNALLHVDGFALPRGKAPTWIDN